MTVPFLTYPGPGLPESTLTYVNTSQTPVVSCVTEKYVYLVMLKNWGDEKTRQGLTDVGGGITWGAPANQELKVAFPILGKEDVQEDLLPNTLTLAQFGYLLDQLRNLNKIDKESF